MNDLRQELKELAMTYGPEKLRAAAEELLEKSLKSIPAAHIPVISSEQLKNTVMQLDTAVIDVINAGTAKEEVYKEKSDLMRSRIKLETEIELVESEAIMKIKGEARSQFVELENGNKVILSNDQVRDAYRRTSSKEQRQALAQVNAEIARIDVQLAKANDKYFMTKDACDSIRAKANLQAALLNFLR